MFDNRFCFAVDNIDMNKDDIFSLLDDSFIYLDFTAEKQTNNFNTKA